MTHYRTMHVNDQQYQFNIGKRFVKIISFDGNGNRISKDISKEKIGYSTRNSQNIIVTPKMVACFIINGMKKSTPEEYFPHCNCENVERFLCEDPYDSEIHHKINYKYICQKCYDLISMEI